MRISAVAGFTAVPRRDAATAEMPAGTYDAVTSISALHHMDLPAVLPMLAPPGPLQS